MVESFFKEYSKDIIFLNTAIAAVIIFADMCRSSISGDVIRILGLLLRLICARPVEPERHKPVSPAVFVIYFNHFSRFTESRRLTRYLPPLRWALVKYTKDVGRSQELSINDNALDKKGLL
jgi:hypothetical protein